MQPSGGAEAIAEQRVVRDAIAAPFVLGAMTPGGRIAPPIARTVTFRGSSLRLACKRLTLRSMRPTIAGIFVPYALSPTAFTECAIEPS
jgi:hypothetical protein